MEVAVPEAYSADPAPEQLPELAKKSGRRWMKHWVPQDTVLGSGNCYLLKWITEDFLSLLQTKHPVTAEEREPEDEHEVVYLCTYEGCGKIFPEASGLRKHAHVHGEKQFICQYEGCGKMEVFELLQEERTDKIERTHAVMQRFVDSSKLKRHFLIHTGEKHFICPFEGCGKAFSLDFNLRSHMRTHTGENYHICPHEDCGKRYAHEYKLKAHMRSFHDKNIPEMAAASPVTDPEKEIVVPKYTPPPPPPPPVGSIEKPFACPFNGCSKRYIHEYKLNLHLKNAHMIQDIFDDSFRAGRGGASQVEDEIEDESDQDVFQEVVPKYYEQIPQVTEPNARRRGGVKASGKGKQLQINSKPPPVKSAKRKRPNPPPVESNLKLHIKHGSSGRSGLERQELKQGAVAEDSEETEDEDRVNTDEEDDVLDKAKSQLVPKPPVKSAKSAKRKRANPPPVESNLKLHVKHGSSGRSGLARQELKPEVAQDSEETEDEDRENTDEEDKVMGKGKLRIVSKPPAKIVKRKRPNPLPVESNLKLHVKHGSMGRSGMTRQELKPEIVEDSEDEDQQNTDEEDDMGGHLVQSMSMVMRGEDDEETEDDID